MNDLPQASQDYLDELRGRPGARQPATFGEAWDAEWQRSGLDTIGGIGKPFQDAYQELSDAVEAAHGADLGTLTARYGINMGAAVTPDQRIGALNALVDVLPEDKRKELEALRDVRARAADKAAAIEREASDVSGAAYGLKGMAGTWLAGIARQTLDPVNLAAMAVTAPIGGPLEGPVLKVVGRQALAAGAAQAAVEPYVQAARGELGLASGFKEGAIDVAQAALGGAGMAALFRGAGAAIRLARRQPLGEGEFRTAGTEAPARPEIAAIESAPPAAAPSEIERLFAAAAPEDFEAAARHAETRQMVDATMLADGEPMLHAAALENAADAMEAGRPVPAETVRSPAVRIGSDVHEAANHGIAADNAEQVLGRPLKLDEIESGFTTSSGRFVDRNEAAQIAGRSEPLQTGDVPKAEVVPAEAQYSTRGGTRNGLRSEAMQVYREQIAAEQGGKPAPPGAAAPAGEEGAAAKPLGDPVLARDAERALAARPDLEVVVSGPDGAPRRLKVADALQAADEDAAAVRELMDCIGAAPVTGTS